LCIDIIEADNDLELFRLMSANEESGVDAQAALFDLARRASTEELAHYVERGRKGVESNRAALRPTEHRRRDGKVSAHDDENCALKRYEDVLNIVTTVLGERRQ